MIEHFVNFIVLLFMYVILYLFINLFILFYRTYYDHFSGQLISLSNHCKASPIYLIEHSQLFKFEKFPRELSTNFFQSKKRRSDFPVARRDRRYAKRSGRSAAFISGNRSSTYTYHHVYGLPPFGVRYACIKVYTQINDIAPGTCPRKKQQQMSRNWKRNQNSFHFPFVCLARKAYNPSEM